MTFIRKNTVQKNWRAAAVASLLVALLLPTVALAQPRYAVVPTTTIHPGEIISSGQVTEMEVTNPNLASGYISDADDVIGKVSKRTLIAGRTINAGNLRDPYAVTRGSTLRITFNHGGMILSASGTPLQDAMMGEVIRVRNLDTGVIISGTVLADGTVEVIQK